jgi:hypothetical protein
MPDPTIYGKYTESPYVGGEGKVLLADRLYIAAPSTAHPTVAAQGATPAGWSDVGALDGSLMTLAKADPSVTDVTTGLFEILRGQVATKDGDVTATGTIVEYEPSAIALITGDAILTVGAGSALYFGGRPLIQKAFLTVGQNPVTFSEFMHWNPKININFKVVEVNRFRAMQVNARLLKFYDAADTANLARDYKLLKF